MSHLTLKKKKRSANSVIYPHPKKSNERHKKSPKGPSCTPVPVQKARADS